MITFSTLFLTSIISADMRGPRPKNVTDIDESGLKILEIDVFSIFDDLANNLRNNYLKHSSNSTTDPVINNIVYLQTEDNNENSNLNIRSSNHSRCDEKIQSCDNTSLLILTILTLALNIINLFILIFIRGPTFRYQIPPENILCESRSMTQCSSQSRSI